MLNPNPEPRRPEVNPPRRDATSSHGAASEVPVPRFTEYQPATTYQNGNGRSVGAPPVRPRKGRLLIGLVLMSVCGGGGYSVWDGFFRFAAYGIVDGHVVEVMPPWNGEVQHLHVREGERVAPGQLLLTLENPELRQRLARTEEELRLARATLTAESARLEWQDRWDADRHQQAVAEYYEAWGQLLHEEAQLELATRRLERARELSAQQAIAGEDVESAVHAESGQRQKVAKLVTAVDGLRMRADADPQSSSAKKSQLEPHLLRIGALQAEIVRCHDELEKGRIKSTICGVVIKRACLPGDYAQLGDSVLSLLVEGSAEIAMYVRQSTRNRPEIGDIVRVQIRPRREAVSCRVVRIGQRFQPPPKSIERYYHLNEQLLQVFLRPETPSSESVNLCLGAVAEAPRSWPLITDILATGEIGQ